MKNLVKILTKKKLKIAFAESCTGGMLASEITSISGASKVFSLGLVTYSNQAKISVLKVNKSIIQKYGAVSPQCCEAMVKNLAKISKAQINVSITGIARALTIPILPCFNSASRYNNVLSFVSARFNGSKFSIGFVEPTIIGADDETDVADVADVILENAFTQKGSKKRTNDLIIITVIYIFLYIINLIIIYYRLYAKN